MSTELPLYPTMHDDFYTPAELEQMNAEKLRNATEWLDANGEPINTAEQRQQWRVWNEADFDVDEHDYHTKESQSAFINSLQVVQQKQRERAFQESWWQERQRKQTRNSRIRAFVQIVGVAAMLFAAVWMYVERTHK